MRGDSVGCLTPEIGMDASLGSLPRRAYATGILTAWQSQAVTGSPDGYNRPRSQSEAWRLHSRQP